jgi:single-strand DNA-binding protein
MNITVISGHLTRDCEIHENGEWKAINFSIANNDEKRKNKDTGELEQVVSFFEVTYWTKGSKMQNHLTKGKEVLVSGSLKLETWKNDNDENRRKVRIIARDVRPMVWGSSTKDGNFSQPPGDGFESGNTGGKGEGSEDIPF